MEAVGAAASVLGLVAFGLKSAKAINELLSSAKDGKATSTMSQGELAVCSQRLKDFQDAVPQPNSQTRLS